jgi:hypothetical protein
MIRLVTASASLYLRHVLEFLAYVITTICWGV